MTPNQRLRLAELELKLADVVLSDADPDNWAGQGMTLAEMDAATRGDAAWCRKTAVQSVALLARVGGLLEVTGNKPPAEEDDTEAAIRRAEKAASKALDRVIGVRE